MKLFQKSRINFISCPTENIYLEGQQDTYPKRRGVTRVKEINDNGINVCFAQDSMSDPWYPLGNGNMMMILDHGIHIAQMMSPEEIRNVLDLVTVNGAAAMNLTEHYGMEEGIRWAYKAENLNFEKWVHGQELLIISAPVTQRKNCDLYKTIEKAIHLRMSCALLLVGENYVTDIDGAVIDLAERNDFPLFTIPWDVPLVDFLRN